MVQWWVAFGGERAFRWSRDDGLERGKLLECGIPEKQPLTTTMWLEKCTSLVVVVKDSALKFFTFIFS